MTDQSIHTLHPDVAVPRAIAEVAELQEQILKFESFVKRRFDELPWKSMPHPNKWIWLRKAWASASGKYSKL
ncbi:MAG: hypothetical protein LRZ85_08340 [Alphaproteobacteria bacterium]|nr:hypothetical protein [Alphaproteobacteria bacterium]